MELDQVLPRYRPVHRVWIPDGTTVDGGFIGAMELARRRLADTDPNFNIKLSLDVSTIFTGDSHCEFTVTGMPKVVRCEVTLKAGPLEATVSPEIRLGYDMNGEDFALEAYISFKTNKIPATLTSEQQSAKTDYLDKLPDIGELFDDSLKGAISLLPFQIQFPPIKAGETKQGKFKLGRISLPNMKDKGLCFDKMMEIVPIAIQPIFDYFNAANSVVGGNVCGKKSAISYSSF